MSCQTAVIAGIALLMATIAGTASADIVSIIDPTGGQEIDLEIGTLSEAAFEALSPTVQDWEGVGAMVGDSSPFNLGGVNVTGTYNDTQVNASFSGFRTSFTDPDGAGPLNGNWNDSTDGGGFDFTEFNFAGPSVSAVGLAWLGRNNRPTDPTITATVTYGDSTTSMASVTLDGTSGLADGLKDAFIGFDDPTGTGITKLTVSSDNRYFNGWDDIGVVFSELDTPTLRVNTVSGAVSVTNTSSTIFDLDFYTISSPGDALDPDNWNSLSNQGIDAVDGPDPESNPGDGPGETWDESGGSDTGVLTEAFLLGTSQLSPSDALNLGNAFNVNTFGSGVDGDLVFQFHDDQYGSSLFKGIVEYVTTVEDADFNQDNSVNGIDFLIWQRGNGKPGNLSTGDANGDGNVNIADLGIWQNQYGTTSTFASTTVVPEPSTTVLGLGILILALNGRSRNVGAQLTQACRFTNSNLVD